MEKKIGMKAILFLLPFSILIPLQGCFPHSHGQSSAALPETDAVQLRLRITGFTNTKGRIRLAIFNSKENFDAGSPGHLGLCLPIEGKTLNHSLPLAPGTYAIKLFHDENENGRLDTHGFNIPAEGYGFSNNARAQFAPPTWEDTCFTLAGPEHTLHIHLQ